MSTYSEEHKKYLKNLKKEKIIVFIFRFLIIAIFLIGWELLSRYKLINTFTSSSPTKAFKTMLGLLQDGTLLKHIGVTLYEVFVSFSIATIIGMIVAIILWSNKKISKMSKGMQEKLQLILVMSRNAELYILDEPLGGVDPATRDYILDTILSNFSEGASVIISTHLISDIERILDEVIFVDKGKIILTSSADELRNKEKTSIDEIFRRYFKC